MLGNSVMAEEGGYGRGRGLVMKKEVNAEEGG